MKHQNDIPLRTRQEHTEKVAFEQETITNQLFNLQRSSHPIVGFFHLAFKLAPILTYLFMSLFITSSVQVFITTLIIGCVDFWYVKNISGRYMLGMRWWNGDDDLEREGWVFDSYDNADCATDFDRFIFWTCLRGSTIFWLVMVITKILSFSLFWGILVVIIFLLNATNYYGYSMCYKEQSKKIESIANLYGKIYNTFRGNPQPNDNPMNFNRR